MKHLFLPFKWVAALLFTIIAFFIGLLHYLWDFRKSSFLQGTRWLDKKTHWVSKLVGIFIISILLISCKNNYSYDVQRLVDGEIVTAYNNANISYSSGDTIILAYYLKTGSYRVYGPYIGVIPKPFIKEDGSGISYEKGLIY